MKKLTTYISILLIMSMVSSCKKFLDEQPISSATDLTFWKNESDADQGVAAGYALLRTTLNKSDGIGFFGYGDLPTDQWSTDEFRYTDISKMNWALPIAASETGDLMMQMRRYDTFYSNIDQINRCIKNIPAIPVEKFASATSKDNLIGEAYFLRAFNYFYMSRIWGDVPLVTESADLTAAQDVPKSKAADVLAQAISDVNTAITMMSWDYANANNRAVRANKGAAYALLAHIYAWQGDYQNCNATIDKLLERNFYQYVSRDTYLNIFKGKSTEGIFEIAQSGANEGNVAGIGARTLKSPYLSTNTGNTSFIINPLTLTRLYSDTTDKRLQRSFAYRGTTNPICIKYANITYATGENVIIPVYHNNLIIFRLADIKLLKAEALAVLSQFDAAKIVLNEVRAQAGLTAYSGADANLFEAVIDERGRELFLEGHRYYDLVRLARKTGIMKFGDDKMTKADFDSGKYYWPYDPTLLSSNKKLTQSPFWDSKL